MSDLQDALDFYDKVVALPSGSIERVAVGTDHYEWILTAARNAAKEIKQLEAENRKLHDAIAVSYMPSDIKALEKDDG